MYNISLERRTFMESIGVHISDKIPSYNDTDVDACVFLMTSYNDTDVDDSVVKCVWGKS